MATRKQQINYEDYQKLIASRAWVWSRCTGWDLQELISEGNLAFMLAFSHFDDRKSRFSTYLYSCLQNHFAGFINSERRLDSGREQDGDAVLALMPSQDCGPERLAAFREMLDRLSRDGKILVECVLETPEDLIRMLGHHGSGVKITRYALQRYFVGRKGWRISRVWKAFKEIRVALGTL